MPMETSESIYQVLRTLIDLYERKHVPIKSKDIAATLQMHEGHVRNIMTVLKSMGLVISRAGPYGGYIPTSRAYDFINRRAFAIPVYLGPHIVAHATDVDIVGLLSEKPIAILRALNNVEELLDKEVRVGPLPSGIVIRGRVSRADVEIAVEVDNIVSIPHIPVSDVMTRSPITAKRDDPIRDYIRYFVEQRIRGIPVVDDEGRPLGILTASRVLDALAQKSEAAKVGELMTGDVPIVEEDDDVHDVIREMITSNLGRVLVIDPEGRLTGIVTRTDILRRIASLDLII